jgi:hypothetical protein
LINLFKSKHLLVKRSAKSLYASMNANVGSEKEFPLISRARSLIDTCRKHATRIREQIRRSKRIVVNVMRTKCAHFSQQFTQLHASMCVASFADATTRGVAEWIFFDQVNARL